MVNYKLKLEKIKKMRIRRIMTPDFARNTWLEAKISTPEIYLYMCVNVTKTSFPEFSKHTRSASMERQNFAWTTNTDIVRKNLKKISKK